MVALEAAASGVPVVGTAVGVIPELGSGARAIPVGDAAGLAAAMSEFVDNEPSRLVSGRAGRERAMAEYSIERCATRFLNLYEEVGAGSRGGRA